MVKEEGPPLEKGEAPEESEESASTDSGQELGAEARGLRSGTYGDRTESIKRFFSSSSLSAIRVVSSAYLRLLIGLLAILIPACALSSPAFHMMYPS